MQYCQAHLLHSLHCALLQHQQTVTINAMRNKRLKVGAGVLALETGTTAVKAGVILSDKDLIVEGKRKAVDPSAPL
jgi:NAD/NADP transhydrogenase alpha subunit